MAEVREWPGTRRGRALREKLKAQKDLEDAERVRHSMMYIPNNKWAKYFSTSREDMLKSVDTRIGELRKKLGLLA